MSPDLLTELRQQRPFASPQEEAHVGVALTAAVLQDAFEQMLKPHGISAAQYNVLRILRGAEPEGLCRYEVRDRMISRMPDVTRLLDRLEQAGLISRVRGTEDRRVVQTRLTAKGRELVDALDDEVAAEHQRRLGHLSESELRKLMQLLESARANG
ncbi:MAG: MarR family winged helix-turn-helix transcriptional regulator [Gemmatimonadaceae bacterium]